MVAPVQWLAFSTTFPVGTKPTGLLLLAPLVLLTVACGGGSALDLPAPSAVVEPAQADLAVQRCGAPSAPVSVALTNDATANPLVWSALTSGPFAIDGVASGTLTSHATASIAVTATVVSPPGIPVTGSLRITTNDPRRPLIDVPLSVTPTGALLRLPQAPSLGDIPITASSPPVQVVLANDGDGPIDLDFGKPADPAFVALAPSIHIDASSSATASFRFQPTTIGLHSTLVPLIVKSGALCQPPQALALTGKGTLGVVLTSPGTLDFGLVDCGAQATPQVVHVENKGDGAFDFSTKLATGTAYVVSPATATVAPGATVDVTVTPAVVPAVSAVTPNLYGDTLSISTNAAGDQPHIVDLRETAHGAILSYPTTLAAGRALIDGVKIVSVAVTNTGNAPATVSGSSSGGVFTMPSASIPANSVPTPTNVEVRPDPAAIAIDDTRPLAIASSGPTCSALPSIASTTHAYDQAIDYNGYLSGAKNECVVGHTHRTYCRWDSPNSAPFASPSPFPIDVITLLPGVVADQVIVSRHGAGFRSGTSFTWNHPGGSVIVSENLGGTFAAMPAPSLDAYWMACARFSPGNLKCMGWRSGGRFGNGTDDGQLVTLPMQDAMLGVGPISDVGVSAGAAYVIVGGAVYAAGLSFGGTFGIAPIADGTYTSPVVVPNVNDAARIFAMSDLRTGACVVRLGGGIECWTESTPSSGHPVGAPFDAVSLVVTNVDAGCALRAGGTVRCWVQGLAIDYPQLGPVARLVPGPSGGPYAIESTGRLSLLAGGAIYPVEGFEGP